MYVYTQDWEEQIQRLKTERHQLLMQLSRTKQKVTSLQIQYDKQFLVLPKKGVADAEFSIIELRQSIGKGVRSSANDGYASFFLSFFQK